MTPPTDDGGRPSTPPIDDAGGTGERAVPYLCPFCGEEDLRPLPHGRWHCRSCLRAFSVAFHGLHPVEPVLESER